MVDSAFSYINKNDFDKQYIEWLYLNNKTYIKDREEKNKDD